MVCPDGEMLKQDRQCTCNVILRRVGATILAEEKHAMCMRHSVICGLFGCKIFFHVSIFEKKKNCVVLFSLQVLSNIPQSKKNSVRCYNCPRLHVKYPSFYSCHILIKLDLLQQIFEKNQIGNFVKIHPVAA
jgi:hypothetical protein